MRNFAVTLATLALVASHAAHGAPCAGFSDVDAASAFCPNVEWIKNRGVTNGCNAGVYCPSDPVSRLTMAAFMNRLGTALSPQKLTVDTLLGAVDLDASPTICQTQDFAVTGFPRRAYLDLALAAFAPGSVDVAADLVASTNGGVSWTQLTAVANRGSVAANQWGSFANLATSDLAVGQSVRFGVRVSRVSGTADLSGSRCNLRVVIVSRDGAASPY